MTYFPFIVLALGIALVVVLVVGVLGLRKTGIEASRFSNKMMRTRIFLQLGIIILLIIIFSALS